MRLKKIKEYFSFNDEIDLSRRKVIKTAAGLAALTVVGFASPNILKIKELHISQQIKNGTIECQVFYLTEPIIIDIPNVIIQDCYFEAIRPMEYMLHIGSKASYTITKDCHFNSNLLSKISISFSPRNDNMSNTLKAAIDAATYNDTKVYLPKGNYKI